MSLTCDLARAALHRAGFSLKQPSFSTEEHATGGAVVVLLDGAALEQRVVLAADVLGDRFHVLRAGARLVVTPRVVAVQGCAR